MGIRASIRILRPHQYVKNFFIFAPLFFAGRIEDVVLLAKALMLFVSFCLLSSAAYVFNDYYDREADRLHPTKKYRPFASGTLGVRFASLSIGVLVMLGLGTTLFLFDLYVVAVATLYFLLNVLYTLRLKHMPVVDVFVIALFFLMRVTVGSMATDVPLSVWIILMTFLLSLFLALAKRRDDVLIYAESGQRMRKVIDGYNIAFLDTSMGVMAAISIVAYIMYTLSPEVVARFRSEKLYISTFFVILGFMRYLQVTLVKRNSGSPTDVLLRDRVIQMALLTWVAFFAIMIYLR